jgi:hypothetical protein
MADTLDPKFIDKRTHERYIRSGQLDEKAWQKHITGLPDVAEKSTTVETRMTDEPESEDYDDEGADDELPEDPAGGTAK